jgi:hypothetical protein
MRNSCEVLVRKMAVKCKCKLMENIQMDIKGRRCESVD